MSGVIFDKATALRILKAVRAWEKARGTTRRAGTWTVPDGGERWAKIGEASSAEDDPRKYSWIAQKPQEDGTLEDHADWGEGSHEDETGYAVSVNGRHAAEDTIVRIYKAQEADYWIFDADCAANDYEDTDLFDLSGDYSVITTDAGELTERRLVHWYCEDDEINYVYRDFTYDACGRLIGISGEI